MNNQNLTIICEKHKIQLMEIKRFSTGCGNYVFHKLKSYERLIWFAIGY